MFDAIAAHTEFVVARDRPLTVAGAAQVGIGHPGASSSLFPV